MACQLFQFFGRIDVNLQEEEMLCTCHGISRMRFALDCSIRFLDMFFKSKFSKDILAVAYGESKYTTSAIAGLILCWSLKNPEV